MTDEQHDNTQLRHDSAPPSLFMRIIRKETPGFEVYDDANVYGFLAQDVIRNALAS